MNNEEEKKLIKEMGTEIQYFFYYGKYKQLTLDQLTRIKDILNEK